MSTISVMCRQTGKALVGVESLRQRLYDCLNFPKHSLVEARDYGADLMSILDKNMTPTFAMDAFVVVTAAINDPASGLPDFKLDSMGITALGDGWVDFVISGTWVPSNEPVTLEGVRVGRG